MFIEKDLFDKIVDSVPLLCVDGLIVNNGKILLLKRSTYPAFGEWWFPGGRVHLNESLQDSIIRKVKTETNLDTEILEQIGVCETIFEKKHTVNICYLLRPKNLNVTLNSEHDNYSWFFLDDLPISLDVRLLNIINKLNKSKHFKN